MYASIYIHTVPVSKAGEVLAVLTQATEIYDELGALGCRVYLSEDLHAKYGCTSFTEALDLSPDEVLLVELNVFRDKAHHDGIMLQVDSDDRITALYERLKESLDPSKVVRGEFTVEL